MFRSLNISKFNKGVNNSTDFDFLMMSMQREKENTNQFNWIDPIDNKTRNKRSSNYLLTKSKMSSPMTHSQTRSNNNQLQGFLTKVSTFVEIALRMLQIEEIKGSKGLAKQLEHLGQQIQAKMSVMQGVSDLDKQDGLSKLIQLQKENQELKDLIHSHQLANIRMHIKINDGESDDIEGCKQKLEQAYASYKKLQDKVIVYKVKIKELQNENNNLAQQTSRQQKTIQYLQGLVKKKTQELCKHKSIPHDGSQLQQVIDQQNNQLQRMYHSLLEIVNKHQEKESMWSDEVIKYKQRIKELERKTQLETETSLLSTGLTPDNDYLRYVLIQASSIQKLLG